MRYNKLKTYDYVGHRKIYYTISIVLIIIGIVSLLLFGLNRGVDFNAGTVLDISATTVMEQAKLEEVIASRDLEADVTLGGSKDRATLRFHRELTQEEVNAVMADLEQVYGELAKEENTVSTDLANELARKAIYGVLLSSIGIIIYVTIRFEWRYALACVISMLHDAFLVIAFFSLFRLEVDLTFVAAVLTIIGYSINDTIVIFDRIRENMRFAKLKNKESLAKVINDSIAQTLTRSINTGLSVLFGSICLYILGSEAIRNFSLGIFIGVVFGVYSSIFIASQLWFDLRKNSLKPRAAAPAAAKE